MTGRKPSRIICRGVSPLPWRRTDGTGSFCRTDILSPGRALLPRRLGWAVNHRERFRSSRPLLTSASIASSMKPHSSSSSKAP